MSISIFSWHEKPTLFIINSNQRQLNCIFPLNNREHHWSSIEFLLVWLRVCVCENQSKDALRTLWFCYWKPGKENVVQTTVQKEAHRLPCKLSLQFKINKNKQQIHTNLADRLTNLKMRMAVRCLSKTSGGTIVKHTSVHGCDSLRKKATRIMNIYSNDELASSIPI